jgi:hypothetical protein
MGFLDKLKSVFGAGEKEPDPEPQPPSLPAELTSAATIDPFLEQLRMQWLRDSKPDVEFIKRLINAAAARFPEQQALISLLGPIYGAEKLAASDAPLLAYATSLTHTPNLAFEGQLYRVKALLEISPRGAICSLLRAVATEREELDLMRWYASLFLNDCALTLQEKAEKDLGSDDAACAFLLGFVTLKGSTQLLSPDWRERVSWRWPSCVPRVTRQSEWQRSASFEFLNLAQEHSAKASLNPVFIGRSQRMVRKTPPGDFVKALQDTIVRVRTKETTNQNFLSMEVAAHNTHMASLWFRLQSLAECYDGCLGVIELKAELAAAARKTDEAVETLRDLLRRKPDQSYYAFRAAQILVEAGRSDEARPYWVHAARTLGSGWRSKLASIAALVVTYDFEVERLKSAPELAIPRAAAALAAFLESRTSEAWSSSNWTVAYALEGKAAQLYHLAATQERDRNQQKTYRDNALRLYGEVDDLEGIRGIDDPVPDSIYDPIVVPLTTTPV